MRANRPWLGLAAGWLFALVILDGVATATRALEGLDSFPTTVLAIRAHAATQWFTVWIADTEARSEQGLMFQRWVPQDHGMLFPLQTPRLMRMWMKNTLIPLDMLFIDAQGRIVYIREHATPLSEDNIVAPVPVKAVLELAGGESAKLGIKVGDRVQHSLFGSAPPGPVNP